jgi:hypothetical protein
MLSIFVPADRSGPIAAYAAPPFAVIQGMFEMDSTLLTIVGFA